MVPRQDPAAHKLMLSVVHFFMSSIAWEPAPIASLAKLTKFWISLETSAIRSSTQDSVPDNVSLNTAAAALL